MVTYSTVVNGLIDSRFGLHLGLLSASATGHPFAFIELVGGFSDHDDIDISAPSKVMNLGTNGPAVALIPGPYARHR